ncbi:MAG: transcriptional regulator [Devosiaceae bacterium]|nr:transcriptional regulator [Devosiaceae bacterium]
MSQYGTDEIDPVIHGKVRLGIMAFLASVGSASFVVLREKTGTTDGNLSSNLRRLEEEKYIKIKKSFEGRKPLTLVILTKTGRAAWVDYLNKMLVLLNGEGN